MGRPNPELDATQASMLQAWIETMRDRSPDNLDTLLARIAEYTALEGSDHNFASMVLAAIGEDDRAMEFYLRMLERGPRVDRGWLWLPPLAPVRQHPKCGDIVEALQLPDYWHNVEWPDRSGRAGRERWHRVFQLDFRTRTTRE